jgi:hypothetical protein
MKGWIPILAVVLVGVTLFGYSTWDRHRRAEAERVEASRVAAIQAAEKAAQDKRAGELKAQAAEQATGEPARGLIVPADCVEQWKAGIENLTDAMEGRKEFDARKEEDYKRCVANTSDAKYKAWVTRQDEMRIEENLRLCDQQGEHSGRCREGVNRREARRNAPEPVRKRWDADEWTIAGIRAAIALYYGRNDGKWPPSKQVVLTLVSPPPSFQCFGNDFNYDPATGEARLLIDDPSRC